MLLNDIGKAPTTTLKKINQYLEANYQFKISESVQDQDLVAIMEQIQEEITDLKIKGEDAKASPEISKRLLVLEGIKSLREFAMVQFQSPLLDKVVKNLVDFVVDTFHISGYQGHTDFEKAMEKAMDEYRSSRYRFPDDMIEQRVRQEAMQQIQASQPSPTTPQPAPVMEDEGVEVDDEANTEEVEESSDPWDSVGKRASARGGHAVTSFNDRQRELLGMEPMDQEEQVPMIRDKNGRMVPDPFAAHAAARRKGMAMKESQNLVKRLRTLLETEVSQAEVMMAAKGFAQELQEMVEKIGRLQNEDLPPVTDQMRETYGTESAMAFQTQIYGALQGVMDALYTAKGQVDDAVANMATTGQVGAAVDMDKDLGMAAGAADAGIEDPALDGDLDLDNIGDELGGDEMGDEFGGEMGGEEPLGRAMKEAALQKKIVEMQKLVAKAKKLKEARK